MTAWHSIPVSALMKQLDSGPEGLSAHGAARRLEESGPNRLEGGGKPALPARILAQLKDPMILVLLGAAGLSLAVSRGEDWLDSLIILIIVVVNGVISITQEDHAQQHGAGGDDARVAIRPAQIEDALFIK